MCVAVQSRHRLSTPIILGLAALQAGSAPAVTPPTPARWRGVFKCLLAVPIAALSYQIWSMVRRSTFTDASLNAWVGALRQVISKTEGFAAPGRKSGYCQDDSRAVDGVAVRDREDCEWADPVVGGGGRRLGRHGWASCRDGCAAGSAITGGRAASGARPTAAMPAPAPIAALPWSGHRPDAGRSFDRDAGVGAAVPLIGIAC